MTKRQKEEIEFLAYYGKFAPTDKETKHFIEHAVFGKSVDENNRLLNAKRSLEITAKMWREDLIKGLLSKDELLDDYGQFAYFTRFLNTMLKGVKPTEIQEHIKNVLHESRLIMNEEHRKTWVREATVLTLLNFA